MGPNKSLTLAGDIRVAMLNSKKRKATGVWIHFDYQSRRKFKDLQVHGPYHFLGKFRFATSTSAGHLGLWFFKWELRVGHG